MVQNAEARLLAGNRFFFRIFISLHCLPVKLQIEYKILVFGFKALHGFAPTYLSDILHYHNPLRSLRSGTFGLLSVRRSRLKHHGNGAFKIVGPKF